MEQRSLGRERSRISSLQNALLGGPGGAVGSLESHEGLSATWEILNTSTTGAHKHSTMVGVNGVSKLHNTLRNSISVLLNAQTGAEEV